MKKTLASLLWVIVAIAGGWAYYTIAFQRKEPVASIYILVAALCSYAIGYRFYSKWIAARVLTLNDRRATPCEIHDDGKDFCKTNKWIVFGHHFAAISGPGPLVGPVLAAQFGYLPGTLWILIGVVLGGAVQDFMILFASMRRDGKSLGQMVKEELNTPAGYISLIAILAIMIILLAVLGLVVVKALAESPWGIFTVGATIPIALFMGAYLRFLRVGKVLEASFIGISLLLLAVWGGRYASIHWAEIFGLKDIQLAWIIIVYGLAASILPVWLLLAPRDYLSTFMKLGTIFALAVGIFFVLPTLKMPALTQFVNGSGPVVAGKVFPFCFITIACGAISGFHTLIASGTTPKIITRESHSRSIGYGAMCLESLVAIMAMIAACTLDPGVYLSMNMKGDPAATVAAVNSFQFPVTLDQMDSLAKEIGETTLFGRTGGAATLAVGMAHIFSKAVSGHGLDLWYHFAIMFEALFILTTIDAGTRVGRYILQDFLGNVSKPLGDTRKLGPNLLASCLIGCGWGYFLIQGVRDPLGGINSLWPLFGIANQMLAAIALCLATTIILKISLKTAASVAPPSASGTSTTQVSHRSPLLALIAFVPLVWLLATTMTAGVQKIAHPDPRIGFLAQATKLRNNVATLALEKNIAAIDASKGIEGAAARLQAAEKKWKTNQTLIFNNLLDAVVAGAFLVLVAAVVCLSVTEWVLLLTRKKIAALCESPPVWLPDYMLNEPRRSGIVGIATLALLLVKELSGEAHLERAQRAQPCSCETHDAHANQNPRIDSDVYVKATEERFNGIRRCC